jgi:ketosteroid isomerase-like protein
MSEENVEVFHRWAELWNRRDFEAGLAECIHPEVEWRPITAALDGIVYRGHAGLRRWIEQLFRDWEVFEISFEEAQQLDDDRMLVLGSWKARGRGSGIELDQQRASWLTDFRDGKVVRMQTFTDRRQALEAAGLSE